MGTKARVAKIGFNGRSYAAAEKRIEKRREKSLLSKGICKYLLLPPAELFL